MRVQARTNGSREWIRTVARETDRFLSYLVVVLLFAMMAIVFLDVLARYLFAGQVPGSFELAELMLGTMIFTALPTITRFRKHVYVDLIDTSLPAWILRWLVRSSDLLVGVVLGIVAHLLWQEGQKMLGSDVTTEFLRIPLWPFIFYFCAMAGFGACMSLIMACAPDFWIGEGHSIDGDELE